MNVCDRVGKSVHWREWVCLMPHYPRIMGCNATPDVFDKDPDGIHVSVLRVGSMLQG